MKNVMVKMMLVGVFMYAVPVTAQQKTITISGKVTSFEESLPLEGVSIVVKGSDNSTGTQADGTFSMVVLSGEKLLLSLAGYEKKEVVLTNAKNYDIVLKRSDNVSAGERPGNGTVFGTKQNKMLK